MFWSVAPSDSVTVKFGRQVVSSNEMKKNPDAI